MTQNYRNKKVTIYKFSDFGIGILKQKGTLIDYGYKDNYSGKSDVPWYEFRAYKKRNTRKYFISESRPYFLIIDGWNGPNPDGIFDLNKTNSSGVITVKHGRYMSCDPRWKTDFDKVVRNSNCTIIFDHRHTQNGEIL